jgi:A/G-specific adenine glycosylase
MELKKSAVAWFRSRVQDWAASNLRDFPWRHTKESYNIFVAEFLLQQTDAPRVVPVYEGVIEMYPNIETMKNASVIALGSLLRPLGFHFRAKRLLEAVKVIDVKYQGIIPDSEKDLLILPGVGLYVARSICANAFGQPLAVVDTNIIRIYQRFFGLISNRARPRNDPLFWDIAQQVAPRKNVGLWNLSLIDFGALVCTARNPKCENCPVAARCVFYKANMAM